MKLALEIIAFLVLLLPIVWEVRDDRHGDPDKTKDVIIRATMMVTIGLLAALLRGDYKHPFDEMFMSFALFFLLFDYAMAVVLKKPLGYLGTTSKMDRFKLWVKIGPMGRFAVRLAVFAGALIWYF